MTILKYLAIASLLLSAAVLTASAAEENGARGAIRVVATIPDLADMASEVGGELVTVQSLTKGTEDMHSVPAKPSFLLILNKADALIEMGLDNEHAWLPDLLYNCRNDRIQPGAPGFINASAGIAPLERCADPSRSEGEIHPEGNPHYNLDPLNAPVMVKTICEGFCRAFPKHAETFRLNRDHYLERLDGKMREWQELAAPLKGAKVITYHRSWSYFAKRFGLDVAGEIEPMPGIAPTASHLAGLIRVIRNQGVELIIKESYFSDRVPAMLQEKTGIPCVTLPNMSGGSPETETYIAFMEHNLKALLAALKRSRDPRSFE